MTKIKNNSEFNKWGQLAGTEHTGHFGTYRRTSRDTDPSVDSRDS